TRYPSQTDGRPAKGPANIPRHAAHPPRRFTRSRARRPGGRARRRSPSGRVLAGLIGEGPAGDLFVADISEVVITRLNSGATVLVIESWTLGARSQTAGGGGGRAVDARPEGDGWAITDRLLKDLTRLGDRVWLVADDVHALGPA